MKICFFLSDITKVGGIERVTSTLIQQLVHERNLDIEIVSMFKCRDVPNYPIPDNVKIHYLVRKPHGAKPHSLKRAVNMFSKMKIVSKFFRMQAYDIIIAQSFPSALLLFMCNVNRKSIVAVEHVYAGYYGALLQKIRDYAYNRVRKVVVLTSNDVKFFEKRGINNVIQIPNPVLPMRGKLSDCYAKRIIAVGRLVYQKGFENLIDGFKRIHMHYPDWSLDIFGDGPMKEELQQKITSNGLNGIVTLKGLTNQVAKELAESSVFVLSSRFEGFPMVLVEAMNQGVPCVAYDCPNGPSDIIRNGHNGLLVENQNLDKLVDAIEYMIAHVDERVKMGLNAPSSVSQFSEAKVAAQWLKLINSL
jgi:glycosyltransferase involved in cell wall biosynthesis